MAAQLQNAAPAEDLVFVSANITTWSPEIFRWHQPGQGPLLIQELHLGDEGVGKLRIDALSKGYHLFLPPVEGPRPTKGGVATLIPVNMQGRHRGGYLSEDGAGFVIVELPRVRYSLLLVNLYLRPGVGLTGGPNPQIIARLLPLLKQGANWIVAGDWNYPSQELEETSLPMSFRGKVVAPGEATISTGNCLDFAVASLRVAPLLQCSANWSVPFRPHAAVAFRLSTSGGQVPLPQLSAFEGSLRPSEKEKRATGQLAPSEETSSPSSATAESTEPMALLGCFGRTWLASTPANLRFAHFTTSVAKRHFTKPGGRGCARPIVHKPLMQPKAGLPWYGHEAAWWQKVQQAWEPPLAPSSRFQTLKSCCPDPASASLTQALACEGIVHPSPVDYLCSPPVDASEQAKVRTVVKAGCSQAVAEARDRETLDYQRWLLGASVKGMKPLFRAVKKQETVVVRPFLNEPAEARPFLRLRQWARLWDAQGTPPPAIPGLKERATRQAEALPAINGFEFEKLIRRMPSKAAGLDGWSVDLLKSLDSGEVASLASMWREIEVTGEIPTQMTFTAFIMLAKTETIERPIGLMSTLLKLGMKKARWGLIEQWLVEYQDHLWWDCALPSRSTHDASLRRGFAYEAHADRVHRCSLFVDLSTFYEGVDHLGLCEAASRAGFPDLLLHLALEAYRGGRIIVSDEVASPTAYACKGIIAGCPLAPTLSKLAVGESIRQTCTGPDIDYVGTWIDDISVDTENKQAERAAAAVVRVFRRLHKALTADGHQVSIGKTYFVASSPAAERALKKKLGAGDPPIQSVAKDLGMELTGGRRRCTHLSSARRRKATARLGKLKGLRIKSPRTTSRIFSMSVLASGQWGHQAQGVSPKVMRSVRLQAASIAGRVNTGSIEVALEMGGPLVQDPLVSTVTQHFKALARVLVSLRDREHFYATDASGGPYAAGPRGRVVAWAVCAFTWNDGAPLQVGSMTGVLPPGSTVAEGECFAIARLCSRLEAEADCTTDCRVATSQQNKALRPWPWAQALGKERLAQLCWTRSHTTEPQHAEEFGAHSSWRRDINAIADVACGEAVKEALRDLPAWNPEEADDLAREVSQYLQKKVEVLLTSVERPPWEEREASPPLKKPPIGQKEAKRQTNQHRPGANGGPNKRERIKTMVATGSGGHDWKTNMQASCRRCTLFVQQAHKPAVFDRIEAHPCLGREQPVPEGAGVHPSHIMANVGRAWICKRCFIHLWVSYEKIPPGVTQQCRPSRKEARAGGGQLAPFLPTEHRPSWLQTEQQPATVPPRSKNRARAKSGPPSCKEPPKLHSFFTTPPPPLPAAAYPPQDLGSREVGSKQQHNQQQASQPHTQPDTLFPESRPGRELDVSQAGCSQSLSPYG